MSEDDLISYLNILNSRWNDEYLLFAQSGTLLLVNRKTGLVVDRFLGIICDGGDSDFELGSDGEEYMI